MATAGRTNDPALRRELAEGLRPGQILWSPSDYGDSIGDSAQALATDRKAMALLEPLARERPADDKVRRDVAQGYLQLG